MPKRFAIFITSDFWESVGRLPNVVSGKVLKLIAEMMEDPWKQKWHPEKVKGAKDDRIWSARVDANYRLIWAHIGVRGKPGQIIFLYVGKHDLAYNKAKRLGFRMNEGMVQVEEIVVSSQEEPKVWPAWSVNKAQPEVGKLFMSFRDEDLLSYGVPEDLLPQVRGLDTDDELFDLEQHLSPEVFNNLVALAIGKPSWARVPSAQLHRSLERYHGGENLHLFVNSEEFERALEGEWEDWMLFLAPPQRRLVYADYAGPARVKGVAGSGKTVVAIHRALHLARTLGQEGKILFFTYGNRLPGVVNHLLKRLAGEGAPELEVLECQSIHKWCYRELTAAGERIEVADKEHLSQAFQAGLARAKVLYPNLKLWKRDETFFADEIRYAIKGRALTTFDEYAALDRSGRGTALSSTERRAMWEVYQGYQEYLHDRGLWDFDDFVLRALQLVEQGRITTRYRAAVVDEIQDLNVATMKLIRALVPPGPNDLFLVGDGLQKLFPGGYVLSQLGIDIVGRGTLLRCNYRNTQQILRAAYAMVHNLRYNDLDDQEAVVQEPEYSSREGPLPTIKGFDLPETEVDWVTAEIDRLMREEGYRQGDFAILYRFRRPYKKLLEQGLRHLALQELTADPATYFGDHVKHTTFDSAKGLEFKVVFLVGVTDGSMVPRDDWSLEGPALADYLTRERSRLFVAMTRARDRLYITYSRGQLSRFLAKLPAEYFDRR